MSYKIAYEMLCKQEKIFLRKKKYGKKIVLGIIGSIIAVALILSHDLLKPADILIPGDSDVTKAAFSNMVQDLQQGVSPPNAVAAFCQQVLDGADS